jgi:subtilisin family serine protease
MKRRFIGILTVVAFLACTAAAQTIQRTTREDVGRERHRSDQVIVRLSPGTRISHFNDRQGTRTLEQIPGTDYYVLELPQGSGRLSDRLRKLTDEPGLLEATPNFTYSTPELLQTSQAFIDQTSQAFIDQTSQAFIDQTSQAFIDQTSQAFIDWKAPASFSGQKAIADLNLVKAHLFARGAGIKVAIIDTGLDFHHPLFRQKVQYPVYDFVDDDGHPAEVAGGAGYGHGTFIAGLIVLTAPQATLMPLRAFDADGSGTSVSIAKAIRYAADNGADVINMSFGMMEEDSLVKDALLYAALKKAYLVAAAGNDDEHGVHFPASSNLLATAVTATGAGDVKAPFANYHRSVDVSAPGVDVYSAYPGGRFAWWSGTSFSTAFVSGEAALLKSLRPDVTKWEIDLLIALSSINIDKLNPKYAGKLGRGRIQFESAIQKLLDYR